MMLLAMNNKSTAKRSFIALAMTIVLAIAADAISFYRGWFPGYEVVVFGVPFAFAMLFYSSVKGRIVAWIALTATSILSMFVTTVGLWLFGP